VAAPASGREHLSAAACGTQYDAQYDAKGRRQEIAEPAGQSSKGESGKKLNSVRRK
jgi:YD repeat-containing protein